MSKISKKMCKTTKLWNKLIIFIIHKQKQTYRGFAKRYFTQIFMFSLMPNVDLWIGGDVNKYDKYLTLAEEADIYIGVPNIQTVII